MQPLLSLLTCLCLSAISTAWNTDVHNQIAFLAEARLQLPSAYPHTLPILSQLLEPEYNGSIGKAAAWADAYAHTEEGAFSYPWHWIDSQDETPKYCNVYYNRDCAKAGCVVRAIVNQTQILKECVGGVVRREGDLAGQAVNVTCSQALKWVVHFIGDISQPLHASGRAAGGNLENVTWGGEKVDLHKVWDGYIIYSAANVTSFPTDVLDPYFKSLGDRIDDGGLDTYEPSPSQSECDGPRTPAGSLSCALGWARESNAWTCDYVYGRKGWDTEDLKTSGYAENAHSIVDLRVSKAAVRLASWLEQIVEHEVESGSGREMMLPGLDGGLKLQP